jgi:hypothetical protein
MPTFVKKPAEVEAIQFTGGSESAQEVIDWITERGGRAHHEPPHIPGGEESGRVETEDLVVIDPAFVKFGEPGALWTNGYVLHEDDGFKTRTEQDFTATYDPADQEA